MHPLTYLHLQMQLEGIGLVGDRLVREEDVPLDGDLPLLLIARLSTREVVTYFDESLPLDLHRKLIASLSRVRFPVMDPVYGLLKANNLRAKVEHSITYIFFTNPAGSIDKDVARYPGADPRLGGIGFSGLADQVFAIECDGRIVSACGSARENGQCGEAWVQTDPAYRRRGMASKVIHAWANSLISKGKIPFYSHEAGNKASAGLAKRLGLKLVFEEINLRKMH